mgnify:CR=1 FL=1
MRKFKLMLTIMLLIMMTCPMKTYASENLIIDEEEWKVISELVFGSSFWSESGGKQYTASSAGGYKLYDVSSPAFVVDLLMGKRMEDLITESYRWIIPNNMGGDVRVVKKDDQWMVAGSSVRVLEDLEIKSDIIQLAEVEAIVKALSANSTVIKQQCFCGVYYNTNFVLLEVESGEEYLIPYGARPLWSGLENGKLYTVAEVCEILSETYHSNGYRIGGSNDNGGGGGTARIFDPASDPNNGMMILLGGVLMVAGVGGLVLLGLKRKRPNK